VEQLLVILIFAAIAVANQFLKKSREGGGSVPDDKVKTVRPPVYRPVAQQRQESDEERMRKFMEALGVPATSPPPRKIERPVRVPQPVPSSRPAQVVKSAPAPPALPRNPVQAVPPPIVQPVMAGQSRLDPETAFPEAAPVATMARMEEVPTGVAAPPKIEVIPSNLPQNIRAMLRNRDSIRNAILLREILDLPRGLQPYR